MLLSHLNVRLPALRLMRGSFRASNTPRALAAPPAAFVPPPPSDGKPDPVDISCGQGAGASIYCTCI